MYSPGTGLSQMTLRSQGVDVEPQKSVQQELFPLTDHGLVLLNRTEKLTMIMMPGKLHLSCNKFPTIWYVRPAESQTSLRVACTYVQSDQSL